MEMDIPTPTVETEVPSAQYNHVSIVTSSREQAQATEDFYREKLGMTELLRGGPSEEMDWVYLQDTSGTNPLWLEIITAIFDEELSFIDKHGPGLEHHCFVVDDAVKFYARLRGRDVVLDSDVIDFVGAKMFYLRDPAGTRIQVLQMPEGLVWAS
jgi:catechol 2,3-dioxygenase-like lactoylglutathione lyase family enzyme